MTISVKTACNNIGTNTDGVELQRVLESMRKDMANHNTAYAALLVKLDADGGVTDVDYHTLAATKAPTLGTVA